MSSRSRGDTAIGAPAGGGPQACTQSRLQRISAFPFPGRRAAGGPPRGGPLWVIDRFRRTRKSPRCQPDRLNFRGDPYHGSKSKTSIKPRPAGPDEAESWAVYRPGGSVINKALSRLPGERATAPTC